MPLRGVAGSGGGFEYEYEYDGGMRMRLELGSWIPVLAESPGQGTLIRDRRELPGPPRDAQGTSISTYIPAFEVLEQGRNGHPGSAKFPRASADLRDPFDPGTLGPFCHSLTMSVQPRDARMPGIRPHCCGTGTGVSGMVFVGTGSLSSPCKQIESPAPLQGTDPGVAQPRASVAGSLSPGLESRSPLGTQPGPAGPTGRKITARG